VTYSAYIWGLEKCGRGLNQYRGDILGIPTFEATGVVELEEVIHTGKCNVLWLAVKCWLNILHVDKEYVAREYYGWQVINLIFGRWTKILRKELRRYMIEIFLARPVEQK
jgi:hypothetical protein